MEISKKLNQVEVLHLTTEPLRKIDELFGSEIPTLIIISDANYFQIA